MDAAAIFALISKGLALIPILIQAGAEIETIIANLKALSDSAQAGAVTDDQVNALEAELAAAIAEFNAPMSGPT